MFAVAILLCAAPLSHSKVAPVSVLNSTDTSALLRQARQLFYKSVEDEEQIDAAETAFRKLMALDKQLEGRATTYLGALVAIRGKHAFWPHDKWRLANEGIELMDKGVAIAPSDVEALFIHGSTCYYLPFFFKRSDDAQQKFRKIVQLLPSQKHAYDADLLLNVVQFMEENAELDDTERQQLSTLRRSLAAKKTSEG